MAKPGEKDLETISGARLAPAERDALLERQTECTVVFSCEGGWPAAVIMSFMRVDHDSRLLAGDGRGPALPSRPSVRTPRSDRAQAAVVPDRRK